MRNIDKILNERKEELEKIEVPKDLENRLNNALKHKQEIKRKRTSINKRLIAACMIILLIGFNFNTLAFYSKKLVGYDQLMSSTLKKLNDLGKGQAIGESHTFSNGVIFKLDGVMIDENQLLAFYTVTEPSGEMDIMSISPRMELRGFFKRYSERGGSGEILEDSNKIKWIMSFEPPRFYERTLQLDVYLNINGQMEEGSISFKLDRHKAMKSTLKQTINKSVDSNRTSVHFDSIVASPTTTRIEGSIQNILQLVRDQISGERVRPNGIQLELIVNDQKLESLGGSMSTDIKGITFSKEFDALPNHIENLKINLNSFSVDKDVNKTIELNKDIKDFSIDIEGQVIEINEIYETKESTFIKFTSEECVTLTRIFLIVDDEKINLKETLDSQYNKDIDDESITHTRTMSFPKVGESYKLLIERMAFSEKFDEVIEIEIR